MTAAGSVFVELTSRLEYESDTSHKLHRISCSPSNKQKYSIYYLGILRDSQRELSLSEFDLITCKHSKPSALPTSVRLPFGCRASLELHQNRTQMQPDGYVWSRNTRRVAANGNGTSCYLYKV